MYVLTWEMKHDLITKYNDRCSRFSGVSKGGGWGFGGLYTPLKLSRENIHTSYLCLVTQGTICLRLQKKAFGIQKKIVGACLRPMSPPRVEFSFVTFQSH